MKAWKIIGGFVIALAYLPIAMAISSPVGSWTTIDDKTGQKRAVIHLALSAGTLTGTVVKVYPQPGDTGVCSHCPEAFKDKKVLGLGLLWGLKDEGNGVWSGGSILDPKTGKIYKVKMTVDANKLHVRAYIGMPMLGRTQTWIR